MKCPPQARVFLSLFPRWGCYLEKLWGRLHTGFSRQMPSHRDRLASTGWVLGCFCFLFLRLPSWWTVSTILSPSKPFFFWVASVWYIVTANKHGIQLLQKMYKSTQKEGHGLPMVKGFHFAVFCCSTVYTVVETVATADCELCALHGFLSSAQLIYLLNCNNAVFPSVSFVLVTFQGTFVSITLKFLSAHCFRYLHIL